MFNKNVLTIASKDAFAHDNKRLPHRILARLLKGSNTLHELLHNSGILNQGFRNRIARLRRNLPNLRDLILTELKVFLAVVLSEDLRRE